MRHGVWFDSDKFGSGCLIESCKVKSSLLNGMDQSTKDGILSVFVEVSSSSQEVAVVPTPTNMSLVLCALSGLALLTLFIRTKALQVRMARRVVSFGYVINSLGLVM